MCIWCVYSSKFDRVFWGVHIVQGMESFKHVVNSFLIRSTMHYVSGSWKMKTLSSLHVYIFLCDF